MRQLLSLLLFPAAAAMAAPNNTCLDFSAYRASTLYDGPQVPPKIAKNSPAYRYRTTIKEGAGPPNFAGHLRVVSWGCGSDCHQMALIDVKTGRVRLIEGWYAAVGYEYRVNSRLLLSDTRALFPQWRPGTATAFEFLSESYVWDDPKQKLIRLSDCIGYAQKQFPPAATKMERH